MTPPGVAVPAPPQIVGSRVVLERHRLDRAVGMFAMVERDRKRLVQWLPWVETTVALSDERSYIRHTHEAWKDGSLFDYSILRRGDEVYCGNCGVHSVSWAHGRCEIGYWIGAEHEGRGLVTEAAELVQDMMFGLGMHRIEIRCDPENVRSQGIPERLGYTLEGTLKQNVWLNGAWRDTMVYAKLAPT